MKKLKQNKELENEFTPEMETEFDSDWPNEDDWDYQGKTRKQIQRASQINIVLAIVFWAIVIVFLVSQLFE